MKTQEAITRAGSGCALARLLRITPQAIYQWGETVPELRRYQLRELRPDWFARSSAEAGTRAVEVAHGRRD